MIFDQFNAFLLYKSIHLILINLTDPEHLNSNAGILMLTACP